MTSKTKVFGPFDPDSGPAIVNIGDHYMSPWHEIVFSVVDSSGNAIVSPLGTVQSSGKPNGSSEFQQFENPIQFDLGQFSYIPFMSATREYRFDFSGVTAGAFIMITINSFGG